MGEQLAAQGWVSVLIDPENELEALYGDAVAGPDALRRTLASRDTPIVVVNAATPRGLCRMAARCWRRRGRTSEADLCRRR